MSNYIPTPPGRCHVFVDGSNLYAAVKALKFDMDYARFKDWLVKEFGARSIKYFTAVLPPDVGRPDPLRPLVDWLEYNGYTLCTREAKIYQDRDGGPCKTKGNMDIDLAVSVLTMAPHMDQCVIVSGDGDFISLIEALQRLGVYVTLISTTQSSAPVVSDVVRRKADRFVDLANIKSAVEKLPSR